MSDFWTKCPEVTPFLDGIIDKLVRQIFEHMKAIPKSEIVNARYREKMEERKNLLRSIRADYTKAADELDMLKAEVIKASLEAKKMIVNCLIRRVEVHRDYR